MVDAVQTHKYCFNEAESAVRYTDVQSKWTPNNLRRLFISPDCVVAQFHVGVRPRQKRLIQEKYTACITDPKYVRMITVLGGRAGTNVCSHIEEVVYCLKGVNGVLHGAEADWRAIIASDKMVSDVASLKETIGARFRRLRGFVMFDGSIQELMNLVKDELSTPFYQISDDKEVMASGKLSVVDIHKTDWYKGSYFRPAIYPSDSEEGSLYKHIKAVEKALVAKENTAKKHVEKENNLSGYEKTYSEAFERFSDVYTKYKKISLKLLNLTSRSYLSSQFYGEFKVQHCSEAQGKTIVDYFGLVTSAIKADLQRLGITVTGDKSKATAETLKESVDLFNSMYTFYYRSLVYNYLRFFTSLKRTGKFDIFVEKFCRVDILIPSDSQIDNEAKLLQGLDGFGSGHNVMKSIGIMEEVLENVACK